jgi:hypothetical protein
MPQIRRGVAGVCVALTLLLVLGGLAPNGIASGTEVAATGAHDAVAVVAVHQVSRAGIGLAEHPPGTTPAFAVAVPAAPERPALSTGRAASSAAADTPVGSASRDRSPPLQS